MGTHTDHRKQLSTKEVQHVKGEQWWHVNVKEDPRGHTNIKSKAQGALLPLLKSACQQQKQKNAFKTLTQKEVQNVKPISYLQLVSI